MLNREVKLSSARGINQFLTPVQATHREVQATLRNKVVKASVPSGTHEGPNFALVKLFICL